MVLASDELCLSTRCTSLCTGKYWVRRVLAVLAHVLRDVGDDWLALVTSSWYEDVLARVQVLGWNLKGPVWLHRLHSRLLKVLVRAVLRAIELWLLVW